MDERDDELLQLQAYIEGVDKDVTMILQSLQWDRNHLLEATPVVQCRYDINHKIPPTEIATHEEKCFLKCHGYSIEERMLPGPIEPNMTLVKFSKEQIRHIIDMAAKSDPLFKKGQGCMGLEPLSLDRLQATYTADERRALHDAVVEAVPSCHDLTDLMLLNVNGKDEKETKAKSRLEILAELRDMKRRRTKYRVAAKTRNYSDVLRDVIKTQMEVYSEVHPQQHSNISKIDIPVQNDNNDKQFVNKHTDRSTKTQISGSSGMEIKNKYSKHSSGKRKSFENTSYRDRNKDDAKTSSRSYNDRHADKYVDKKHNDRGYSKDSHGKSHSDGHINTSDYKAKSHSDARSSRTKEYSKYESEYDSRYNERHKHISRRHTEDSIYRKQREIKKEEDAESKGTTGTRRSIKEEDDYEYKSSKEDYHRRKAKYRKGNDSEYRRYYDCIDKKQEKL